MLAIIVPYRDRKDHLAQFIPHMNKYLPDAKIVIVEQADEKPFNRGKLLNVGFLEEKEICCVFHDVDMLPIEVDYTPTPGITQLCSSDIQTSNYLGGVTQIDVTWFIYLEGYHNNYFHRAEDNELMFQVKRKGGKVANRSGVFEKLAHQRTGPEFIPKLWSLAQLPRIFNMLENCHYEVISKEVHETHTHLKVSL